MHMRMTACFFSCVATLVLVLTCGCTPAVVSVNTDSTIGSRFDIDRIFVVLDTREFDENTSSIRSNPTENSAGAADTVSFSKSYLAELATRFEALGVEHKFYRYTGIELSEDDYKVPAKQFKADAVLWVREQYSQVISESDLLGLFSSSKTTGFLLVAYIPGSSEDEEPAWRATFAVDEISGDWSHMARLLASSLVDKLVADGFIESRGPQQK